MHSGQVAQLRQVTDIDELRQVVFELVCDLGFGEFIFSSTGKIVLEHLTVIGSEFLTEYRKWGMERMDPVVAEVRNSRYPIHWDAETHLLHSASEEYKTFWEKTLNAGFASGLSVPVHGPGGQFADFVCISHNRRWGDKADLYQVADQALMLAVVLNAVVYTLVDPTQESGPRLTAREIECMRLTASGRTAQEVAQELGFTTRTANFHIQNVILKLEVASKYQAVLKANQMGLL